MACDFPSNRFWSANLISAHVSGLRGRKDTESILTDNKIVIPCVQQFQAQRLSPSVYGPLRDNIVNAEYAPPHRSENLDGKAGAFATADLHGRTQPVLDRAECLQRLALGEAGSARSRNRLGVRQPRTFLHGSRIDRW